MNIMNIDNNHITKLINRYPELLLNNNVLDLSVLTLDQIRENLNNNINFTVYMLNDNNLINLNVYKQLLLLLSYNIRSSIFIINSEIGFMGNNLHNLNLNSIIDLFRNNNKCIIDYFYFNNKIWILTN